jgi:pyridinium-3,5-biscarboxylic acid mononucleotide sulfurtransferase
MVDKLNQLKALLRSYQSVLVAYSGGVDSTFLLKIAHDILGDKILAVVAESPTYPESEGRLAGAMCESLGVRRMAITTDEFSDENFLKNPTERCYYCKKELFSKLKEIAVKEGFQTITDGSNADDLADFRPGNKAKTELGVCSPMQEVGLTKEEIRSLSKELGLPTWDKPSAACLASRIPYGTRITPELVDRIGKGEEFLNSLGFKQLRVRHHGPIVRIEVEQEAIGSIMRAGVMDRITKKFEELGYTYVTLDLKGYRTGSLNEGLNKKPAL